MDGLEIASSPFKREVDNVIANGSISPCYSFDLELMAGKERVKPQSILGVSTIGDFIGSYYPIIAIEFQTSLYVKELLIANSGTITAVLKTYEVGRNATVSTSSLKNPVIKRYKVKLYLEESDSVTQENTGVNNENYTKNKAMVAVKVQLYEGGFEQLKNRSVGGNYPNISGFKLLRHLIDYHANLDNDEVASLIGGVDFAPAVSEDVREQIIIPHGTTLVESMAFINRESGGIYPTGFSYFIHNNTWYVFPPYALTRYKENSQKLLIVNLPKNKYPGIEKTFLITPNLVTVLSTREVTIKDKRESKKFNFGLGLRFGDAKKLLDFGEVKDNKLLVDGSKNVNDLTTGTSKDGVNQTRFSANKLTSAKNIELSKLAPGKGIMMRVSWENSKETVIYPGMPVKVLYLKNNKVKSMIGTVTGKETAYYPAEQQYPAMKFATLTYLQMFVSDEPDEGAVQSSTIGKASIIDKLKFWD